MNEFKDELPNLSVTKTELGFRNMSIFNPSFISYPVIGFQVRILYLGRMILYLGHARFHLFYSTMHAKSVIPVFCSLGLLLISVHFRSAGGTEKTWVPEQELRSGVVASYHDHFDGCCGGLGLGFVQTLVVTSVFSR